MVSRRAGRTGRGGHSRRRTDEDGEHTMSKDKQGREAKKPKKPKVAAPVSKSAAPLMTNKPK